MSCHHSGYCRCPKFLPSTTTAPAAPPLTFTFPAVLPPDTVGYDPNGYSVPLTFVPTASQAEVDALKLRVAALETRLAALEKTP